MNMQMTVMRKAGEVLEVSDPVIVEVIDTIRRQDIEPALQIASHHVDLDSGREGFINDGIDKSTIYKGGKRIQGTGDEYSNPLQGQPSGAKELRNLDRRDYEDYNNIFEQQMIRQQGTGNYADIGVPVVIG